MHKLSLSVLRERFRSPLIHEKFAKPLQLQPKQVEVIPIVKHDEQPVSVVNSVPQEEKFSSFFIQTQLAKYTFQDHTSSVILQMGFCCQTPNTKLVAVNHTTQLFDCAKDHCPRKLIKVTIGNWS